MKKKRGTGETEKAESRVPYFIDSPIPPFADSPVLALPY
jgi:hypothetical protein